MDILSKDQLLELEDRCIQEKPPAAMAACPLRVDCRSLCMAVKDGNFDVARSIYSKSVPLPHSLSYLCDMPCTSACLRKDLGGAIQMRGLEWAAMQYGKPISRRMLPVRKGGTAAIVGAGPFGLTAASELAKKGLSVTVFEQETNPGGSLRRAKLPQAALEKDLELISKTGVVFCCGEVAEVPAILSGQYDAVLVAAGKALPDADPVTMVTPEEGIFSGGGFTSLVEAIAAGKRAANTIDRYVKHVSITAGREREMDRDTTLFVETSYFDPVEPLAAEFPTKDDAIGEASRCLDCQCMECAKGCAFIAHFKRYPKLYLREIYNNLSIALGNHTSNTMINACALCSQCEVICPNGLDLGAAIQSARDIMVKNKKMPPSAFEFAVDDMRQANSDHSFFFRHQPGSSESRYLFSRDASLVRRRHLLYRRHMNTSAMCLMAASRLCMDAAALWLNGPEKRRYLKRQIDNSRRRGNRLVHRSLSRPALRAAKRLQSCSVEILPMSGTCYWRQAFHRCNARSR